MGAYVHHAHFVKVYIMNELPFTTPQENPHWSIFACCMFWTSETETTIWVFLNRVVRSSNNSDLFAYIQNNMICPRNQ